MDPTATASSSALVPGFFDRLGERFIMQDPGTARMLEILRLRPELGSVAAFEPALRESFHRLANFRHPSYGEVRRIERLQEPDGALTVVSDYTRGSRLSEILYAAEQQQVELNTSAALYLISQLVSAILVLHRNAREISHGAIGPERIVVTPNAHLVIAEYVLGAALERLEHMSRDRLWKDFRLAVPPGTISPRFTHRTDLAQVGLVALSLILGRLLRRDDYPTRLNELLDSATETNLLGDRQPIGKALRDWLARTVQVDPRRSFATISEAQASLEQLLSEEGGYVAAPVALESFLRACEAQVSDTFTPPEVPRRHKAETPPVQTTRQAASTPAAPEPRPVELVVPTPEPRVEPLIEAPAAERAQPVALTPEPPPVTPPAAATGGVVAAESQARGEERAAVSTAPPRIKSSPRTGTAESAFPGSEPPKPRPPVAIPEAASEPPKVESLPSILAAALEAPRVRSSPSIQVPPKPPAPPAFPTSHGEASFDEALLAPPVAPVAASVHPEPKRSDSSGRRRATSVIEPPRHDQLPRPAPVQQPPAPVRPAARPVSTPSPRDDHVAVRPPVAGRSLFGAPDDPRASSGRRAAVAIEEQPGASRVLKAALIVAFLIALGVGGFFGVRLFMKPAASEVVTGRLNVETRPVGAEVLVDGQPRGSTPLSLALPAGPHKLEIRGTGQPREIPVTITAGAMSSQYIELTDMQQGGQLHVVSEPAGARVSVDGTPRGTAPLTIPSLSPGQHAVVLESPAGSVRQQVTIEPGTTASLVVPIASATAPVSGWISVTAPLEVQLFENGRLLGTSATEQIMVAAGRHTIELVNETVAYRLSRTVDVAPGKVAAIKIELPNGSMNLNATPWAEVWIDGQKAGETPLGNVSVTVGPHEVVFRNPQFPEQRHKVVVTLAGPARLSVDLRK
jgi:hypothetical protein